jgi:hypothetical protein
LHRYDPGAPQIVVGYKPATGKPFCGKSVCSIQGLASEACCHSSNKNIKGSELHNLSARKREEGLCKSVWEDGGALEIDIGGGTYVTVPNMNSTAPSEVDIQEALIAAGVGNEEMDELVNLAVADVGI